MLLCLGKDVFALLPTGFGMILIYQLALAGSSQSVIDGERQMVYPITSHVFFSKSACPLPVSD